MSKRRRFNSNDNTYINEIVQERNKEKEKDKDKTKDKIKDKLDEKLVEQINENQKNRKRSNSEGSDLEKEKLKDKLKENDKLRGGRRRSNSEGSDLENEKIENFDEKCHMYNLGDLDLEADNVILGNRSKKENKEMTTLFNKIKLQLYDKTVTIDNILSLKNINELDKVKLVEKYCIMKNNENNLEEYIKYRDILKEEINKVLNMSHAEIHNREKMESEIKRLESLNKISFDLKEKIIKSDLDDQFKSIVYDKYKMLDEMKDKDTEYFKLKSWILQILNIPFKRSVNLNISSTNEFLKHVKMKLDAELYGMKNVKEELMLQIINRFIKKRKAELILSLVGSAGVGKTKIIHIMAESLNLPFYHISLGGIKDGSFLDGFSNTYVGSRQGIIVDALIKMNCNNGIIFFDEIDKISESTEGLEVVNQLIHILDNTQNNIFYDKYISEIPIDLSNIWFICSLNNIDLINPILRNRLYVVDVEGYGTIQKIEICKNIILPKKTKEYGLENMLLIDDQVIEYIVSKNKKSDKGVRELKRNIDTICKRLDILRTSIDENGNYGVLDWTFKIDNLRFPLKVNKKHIDILLNDLKPVGTDNMFC
jgi:ATP-dependent Lon protease